MIDEDDVTTGDHVHRMDHPKLLLAALIRFCCYGRNDLPPGAYHRRMWGASGCQAREIHGHRSTAVLLLKPTSVFCDSSEMYVTLTRGKMGKRSGGTQRKSIVSFESEAHRQQIDGKTRSRGIAIEVVAHVHGGSRHGRPHIVCCVDVKGLFYWRAVTCTITISNPCWG